MAEPGERRNPDYVQSLERGLAVIRAFGAESPELRLSDVARATGLTRAAARRFLLTLVQLGYVRQNGSEFSLRPRVLELGYAYLSALSLPEVAQPHMEALVAEVNESSSIAVLDDLDIVYVARVPTQRIMTITIAVGTRLPAYATSMGRVLLAGLEDDELDARLERIQLERFTPTTAVSLDDLRDRIAVTRTAGWAMVDQELEQGVRSAQRLRPCNADDHARAQEGRRSPPPPDRVRDRGRPQRRGGGRYGLTPRPPLCESAVR
jgi:IclR family transcriptional regulator, pca regulon regulatory protein